MSLARTAKRKWRSVDPVLRALIISILVHLSVLGSWKLGEELGISQKLPLFNIVKKIEQKLLPTPAIALNAPQEREIQLTFVEVDVSKIAEEPKEAKHYGAVNTLAANPTIDKETDTPKIDGRIKEVSKLTENSKTKAEPLRPSPPAPAEIEQEKKTEAKPKETQEKGDLTVAKPAEKPRQTTGTSDSEKEVAEQQQRRRPRTLAEARALNAPGEKRQQDGGVKRFDLSGSFDVKGSVVGSYDQRFIEAVRQCWYDMLDEISATKPGLVRLEFRINFRGQISEMRVVESTVDEMQTLICQRAIQRPAPYGEWPREMRLELKGDYRDVTFTFTYQ